MSASAWQHGGGRGGSSSVRPAGLRGASRGAARRRCWTRSSSQSTSGPRSTCRSWRSSPCSAPCAGANCVRQMRTEWRLLVHYLQVGAYASLPPTSSTVSSITVRLVKSAGEPHTWHLISRANYRPCKCGWIIDSAHKLVLPRDKHEQHGPSGQRARLACSLVTLSARGTSSSTRPNRRRLKSPSRPATTTRLPSSSAACRQNSTRSSMNCASSMQTTSACVQPWTSLNFNMRSQASMCRGVPGRSGRGRWLGRAC